jgi:uncharacterized Zn finger protein
MIRKFEVKGSASEPYQILIKKDGTNLSAFCTCPAGKNGMHCKHRISILSGSSKAVVSDNISEVAEVATWVAGSDIESALHVISELEDHSARIRKELSAAKKSLAKAMRD